MLSDIEISQQNQPESIERIAEKAGLCEEDLELYGRYKAKIGFAKLRELAAEPLKGKLILVTAITPTPAGEGKSTISIGLADALQLSRKKVMLALREPSLGPCFGLKGGATGGGYSQIVPMEDINLHFTGDIHAITAANNLLAAMIDNHIKQGNELHINPQSICWRRCLDLNDRALRNIEIAMGGSTDGLPRRDGFDISVASEIMAILCLAEDINDLKKRLSGIIIGKTYDGKYVTAGEIKAVGAMAALLKDAVRPNLVQTLAKTPALVHGGPFANIAHGCNSLIATKTALRLADYVVTEAGFGADLGAEKFFDIKCRAGGLEPAAVVLVATVRALKMHGGVDKDKLGEENPEALRRGFANLKIHLENLAKFGVPAVTAINRFATDSTAEITLLQELCAEAGVTAVTATCWENGGKGALALAFEVCRAVEEPNGFGPLYDDNLPLKEKISLIAKEIYRAGEVTFSDKALSKLAEFESQSYGKLPVCIAKTQNSISDDPKRKGAPQGYNFTVNDVRLSAGAGFVVALAGNILTMPGLPQHPAAERIDVDENGVISGLF
ncbi:MAG: formate--tetrahydrofolate ligase [Alphaproteobacteria bacterium]|jgi:formate--tetrahydrofolate ligase|uniref:formate--tetrahydrofolate ligase n=1 Tax=Candidatus Scatocola faecigallinarum TaxID=2840916 RepID=UPI0003411769|nr:formate--tetrahydrofolate ligase [Azospirillum sp. CAG:239]